MDWPKVAEYLATRVDGARGPMHVRQFPGGSANLTYLISFGAQEYVLRRPPLGPVAPGAHDMAREHKVLSRLFATFDRAPRSYHLCTDESVIGAKFIVVQRRTGVVIRDRFPDAMLAHPRLAERASFALIDAMADLHNVDPHANGLGDLGRPDGFAKRQVDGWAARWELAKDKDVPLFYEVHRPARGVGAVATARQRPAQRPEVRQLPVPARESRSRDVDFRLGHGDARRSADRPRYAARVLERSDRSGAARHATDRRRRCVSDARRHHARYAEVTGLDTGGIHWYEAFAMWKTAVVVQQIYIRYARGQTKDERFARIAERAPLLLEAAARLEF